MRSIERTALGAQSPLQRFENTLHPWTVFGIMPLFALANAGVSIKADFTSMIEEPLARGVALGLLVGKPLGIMLFSVVAVRFGLATLPSRVRWVHVFGAGCLAGIGFHYVALHCQSRNGRHGVAGSRKDQHFGGIVASRYSRLVGLSVCPALRPEPQRRIRRADTARILALQACLSRLAVDGRALCRPPGMLAGY